MWSFKPSFFIYEQQQGEDFVAGFGFRLKTKDRKFQNTKWTEYSKKITKVRPVFGGFRDISVKKREELKILLGRRNARLYFFSDLWMSKIGLMGFPKVNFPDVPYPHNISNRKKRYFGDFSNCDFFFCFFFLGIWIKKIYIREIPVD